MVLQTRLRASAVGCAACRTSLFRQFILPLPPTLFHNTPFRPSVPTPPVQLQPSPLVSCPRFYSPLTQPEDQDGRPPRDQGNGEEEPPWYLDEEPRRHPTLTANGLAPLPEAPEGSPPILHKLIPRLAEDLGLEELKLLDLRSLDPPAALGPGLIMLLGTARSERHLHISGRTLKSWLRSQGIRADADGVLTRRALEIKSRRQRKKARLMGTAAVSYTGDEGMATRWICMNLGTIGSEPQEESALENIGGTLTGFGTRSNNSGTTIVVQMFTESKRKELDLETLWSRILARRGDPNIIQDDLEYWERHTHHREVAIFDEGGSPKMFVAPTQRRLFSTSYRRFSPPDGSPEVTDPPKNTRATNTVDTCVDPVKYIDAKLAALGQLQVDFASLSFADAIEALEDSPDGSTSKFLKTWNDAIELLPPEQSWVFRTWLVARGRKMGSRRFTLKHLSHLHEELVLNGIMCRREDYLEMLQAIYLEPEDTDVLVELQSKLALRILQTMLERGEAILQTDVIVPLIESLARADHQGDEQHEIQGVLEKLIHQADLPYMGEETVMRLLSAYAYQGNWDRFWEVWRMPPKYLESRSEKLYLFLWNTIAATGSQRLCRQAIRGHFYEMHNESLPVHLTGPIKEAVRACARIAEPSAEGLAEDPSLVIYQLRSSTAEFVRLFRSLKFGQTPGPPSKRTSM